VRGRVNLRPVLVLAVVAALLGGAVAVAHRVQVGRTAHALRARAEAAEAAGRAGEAVAALGKYLSLRPGDDAALTRMARLLARTAATPAEQGRAAAVLGRVLRRRPGDADARRRLAALEAERGRYADALVHLKILDRSTPADAGLDTLSGACSEAVGDAASAAGRYRRALAGDPKRADAAFRLADLLRVRLSDPVGADRVLDALVAADPGSPSVRLGRARYRAAHGLPGAGEDLAAALALAPADLDVMIEVTRDALRRSAIGEARAALDRGEAGHPGDPRFAPLRADLEDQDGHPDAAEAVLRKSANAPGADTETRQALASLMLRHDRLHPVKSTTRDAEIDQILREIAGAPGAPEASAWARQVLAVRLAGSGIAARAREALTSLGDERRDRTEDRRARARVLAALGSLSDRRAAINALEGLPEDGPSAADGLLLVALHESVGDWPRARRRIESLIRLDGLEPEALGDLAKRLLDHDEPSAAAPLVARLSREAPGGLLVAELESRLLRAGGNPAGASRRLSAHASSHPGDSAAVAALLEGLGRPDLAEPLYRDPASGPGYRLALAGFLARRGRGREALDACEGAWGVCGADDVAEATAGVIDALGDDPAALRRASDRLASAAAAATAPARVVTSLASLREAEGRYDDARRLYRRALALDDRDVVALNNLALLDALRGGGSAGSLALIGRAIERAGSSPTLLDTRGVARLAAGDPAGAAADLSEAALGPDPGPASFHMSRALLRTGDRAAAAVWLRKAAASGLDGRGLHPLERPAYRQALAELGRR